LISFSTVVRSMSGTIAGLVVDALQGAGRLHADEPLVVGERR
jgi:hypothetical protein